MRVYTLLLSLVFSVFLAGFAVAGEHHTLYFKRPDITHVKGMQADMLEIKTAQGQIYNFNVELAVTPEQQAKGLMYRTEMADDHGMLFVFNDEAMRSFWMKNTLIPLDIIFVRHDGKIHHIHQNAQPQDLTPVTSQYPSSAVLELKGGTTFKLGIEVGDMIFHEAFMNVPPQ